MPEVSAVKQYEQLRCPIMMVTAIRTRTELSYN